MPRKQTLLYSFDVNELHRVTDACSEKGSGSGDDPHLWNRSKIYVDCNMTQCDSSPASCPSVWCDPHVNRGDSAQSQVVGGSTSIVRLFEWPYADIGTECQRLGRQGWTAVEISPPAAHEILNESLRIVPADSWEERLLPRDLSNLTSRSGTEEDLAAAIAMCVGARVQV